MKTGEVHVIMGPNGAGKSTLASAIVGNPVFILDEGQITFDGEDISLELEVFERARRHFSIIQTPEEIAGLQMEEF